MNEEFLDLEPYSSYNPYSFYGPDYSYARKMPEPIREAPNFVIMLAFGMFFLFCQEFMKMVFGEEYTVTYYLKGQFIIYIKEQLDFYFYNENAITEDDNESKEEEEQVEQVSNRYEDKYLEDFNKLSDDITLTEEEHANEIEQRPSSKVDLEKKLETEKETLRKSKTILENQLKDFECNMINDGENAPRKSDITLMITREINRLNSELEKLEEKRIEDEEINKAAREFVINERLNKLKNNIIIEKTPLGNAVMFYNNSRSSFEYYCDSTIPYRYLETIGRKYVITYKCKQIYVDMNKEIEDAEKKLEEKKKKAEEEKKKQEDIQETGGQDQTQSQNQNQNQSQTQSQKKNVFAKFKTYNKDTSIQSAAVPLDRPAPAKKTAPQEEKIIKERANRYSFEGKLANFSFLKKVDRKVVDKRFAVSFSEFKKMQKNK
jgi:hypothetical protein